jgi:mitochondrial fission protein ELM1
MIISCGASLAPLNFILSKENLAKSIVVMRPSVLSTRRFDLVIIPRHDRPTRRKNCVVTEGALNLINEQYLKSQTEKLISLFPIPYSLSSIYMGLLIGGDTKNFILEKDTVREVIRQLKSVCADLNAGILITTSRRTSREVEVRVLEEFKDYPRCKLLIIANEKNIPQAMGGILGLSKIIITSPDSISMISEAASSNRYVLVFKTRALDRRHRRFLDYFYRNKYIYLVESHNLAAKIKEIWLNRPEIHTLKENLLVAEAVKRII